jgi:hypothetical protein
MHGWTSLKHLTGALVVAGLAGSLSGCMDPDSSMGAESMAKAVSVTLKSKPNPFTSFASGKFGTGPAAPGHAFTFEFTAPKGARFSFVSMFGQSNDWFFAPDMMGIALYDASGNPISGDVTDEIYLWDAGTEENQPPLQGSNQAPRQAAPATGPADMDPLVRMVPRFPVGRAGMGATLPGNSLSWEFTPPMGAMGGKSPKLAFVTMFGQSNDWFFAPDTGGIALWDEQGNPMNGDITSQIHLWDAGTEMDETPFAGPNQGPRQAGPNMGAMDADGKVRMVMDTAFSTERFFTAKLEAMDGGSFRITLDVKDDSKTPISPAVYQVFCGRHAFFVPGSPDKGMGLEKIAEDGNAGVLAGNMAGYDFGRPSGNIRVTIASMGGGRFEARIMAESLGVTPVAPGTYSVHSGSSPLFTPGKTAPDGLESLAEDANPAAHLAYLAKATGVYSPFSPVVWVVTDRKNVLFKENMADSGKGLERLAEDGNPSDLAAYLKSLGLKAGTVGMAPFANGAEAAFEVMAEPGEALHFATMFGQSNDAFFGPGGNGIALFQDGSLRSGDATGEVYLWDAGTEANEALGAGPNQAPRQSAPNTGETEGGMVGMIEGMDGFPDVGEILEVMLKPGAGM